MTFTASELSDKEIMARTTVERQAASGRLQLSFELPMTKTVLTRSIQESAKSKGVQQWCAVVNEAIRNEKAESRARQRKEAALRNAPIAVVGSGTTSPVAIPGVTSTSSAIPAGQSLSSDPNAFVQEQLKAAKAELTEATLALMAANERVGKAQDRNGQWENVAKSLGISTTTGSSESQT